MADTTADKTDQSFTDKAKAAASTAGESISSAASTAGGKVSSAASATAEAVKAHPAATAGIVAGVAAAVAGGVYAATKLGESDDKDAKPAKSSK